MSSNLLSPTRHRKKEVLVCSLLVCAFLATLGVATFAIVRGDWKRAYDREVAATAGMMGKSEAVVRAKLGQPVYVIERQAVNPSDAPYPVPGYAIPPRAPAERTLVYIRGEFIAYIFLDNSRVSDVFVGGS